MAKDQKNYFYVAYVAGTNFFKIGTTCNPKARRHTSWGDAPYTVQSLICAALNKPVSYFTSLKSHYQYVIIEACDDKKAAKSVEQHFRNSLKSKKVFSRTGHVGDWFSFNDFDGQAIRHHPFSMGDI